MIDKFVSSLPGRFGTVIGERGVTLSAGQKARIAIARALVSDPAILILDEANSNLEDNLERILWQNLLKEREGKTTIIFSHHITNIPQIYLHKELG